MGGLELLTYEVMCASIRDLIALIIKVRDVSKETQRCGYKPLAKIVDILEISNPQDQVLKYIE